MIKNNLFKQSTEKRKTKLSTFLWEMKIRFAYVVFSFVSTFFISYFYSQTLLYGFVFSYILLTPNPQSNETSPLYFTDIEPEKILSLSFPLIDLPASNTFPFFSLSPPLLCGDGEEVDLHTESSEDRVKNLGKKVAVCEVCRGVDYTQRVSEIQGVEDCTQSLLESSVGTSFIFTDLSEAFLTHILISLVFSIIFIVPLFGWNVFAFFLPSIYKNRANQIFVLSVAIFTLWIATFLGIQFFLIPILSTFFLQFSIKSSSLAIEIQPKIYDYVTWALTIFFGSTILFIGVVSLYLLILSGVYKISFLLNKRKVFAFLIVLIAAFVCPPNWVTQSIFAAIFWVGFEGFLFFFLVKSKISSRSHTSVSHTLHVNNAKCTQ